MWTSVALLNRAMELGTLELEALTLGDVDKATELFGMREEAMSMAWQQQGQMVSREFGDKLVELQALQAELTEEGQRLKQSIAATLGRSQQETRRMAGYRRSVSYALA